MADDGRGVYQNLRAVRVTHRRTFGTEAKRKVQRELHNLVIQVTEPDGKVPTAKALWWTDLRRGRLNIHGGFLRFIDVCAMLRVPKRIPKMIPPLLDSYIDDAYEMAGADEPLRAA